jgi:two-component sensor histidine kinase
MFALVIHELATNAAKYGSLSVPHGHVVITWEVRDGSSEPQMAFSWLERNGPPVATPTHQGFGSRLISAALASTPRITFNPEGFEYTVQVPLLDVTRASKPLATPEETAS